VFQQRAEKLAGRRMGHRIARGNSRLSTLPYCFASMAGVI
jgi:hypothetical protein